MTAEAEAMKGILNPRDAQGTTREMSVDDIEKILRIEKKSFIAPDESHVLGNPYFEYLQGICVRRKQNNYRLHSFLRRGRGSLYNERPHFEKYIKTL